VGCSLGWVLGYRLEAGLGSRMCGFGVGLGPVLASGGVVWISGWVPGYGWQQDMGWNQGWVPGLVGWIPQLEAGLGSDVLRCVGYKPAWTPCVLGCGLEPGPGNHLEPGLGSGMWGGTGFRDVGWNWVPGCGMELGSGMWVGTQAGFQDVWAGRLGARLGPDLWEGARPGFRVCELRSGCVPGYGLEIGLVSHVLAGTQAALGPRLGPAGTQAGLQDMRWNPNLVLGYGLESGLGSRGGCWAGFRIAAWSSSWVVGCGLDRTLAGSWKMGWDLCWVPVFALEPGLGSRIGVEIQPAFRCMGWELRWVPTANFIMWCPCHSPLAARALPGALYSCLGAP
jgi:hypothetical protein